VPPGYTGQTPVPLVLDWHGILMNSGWERNLSGWAGVADAEGFIVAYPEGIDTAFNLGICCTSSRDVDDLALGRAIVEQIRQQACIDPKRIHSVGYSLGGGMSMYMACNAADLFASIATSAFDLIREEDFPCNPSRPIAIMDFRSTGDPICPYNGGATYPPNGLPVMVYFLGAEGTFAKWAELNGCTGSPVAGAAGCPTYTQCAEGTEVILCTKQGGGHDWMDAAAAWEFLKRHPMP
jgi:polyhydroxybutyrate depolymerase